MPRNDPFEIKMKKTLEVLGLVNLILSPLFLVDSRIALAMALIINGMLISEFHELGKRRRVGANLINQGRGYFSGTFFAQTQEINVDEMENTIRNIINGGGAIHDEIDEVLSRYKRGMH